MYNATLFCTSFVLYLFVMVHIVHIYHTNTSKLKREIKYSQKKIKEMVFEMIDGDELSVEDFMFLREAAKAADMKELSGTFEIHNISKNKYYKGESSKLLNKLYSLFDGRGEIRSDYKNGDKFSVRITLE